MTALTLTLSVNGPLKALSNYEQVDRTVFGPLGENQGNNVTYLHILLHYSSLLPKHTRKFFDRLLLYSS